MMPIRSPTRSGTGAGLNGLQPNLSTGESATDVSTASQVTFRSKRKYTGDQDIKEELREIRKGMAEMMQVLTSINANQTEAINKISEDVSSLKEHVKDLKTEIDSLRFENEKIKRNIENLISKYNEKDKQIETLDSEIKKPSKYKTNRSTYHNNR
ncbi:unnamed protein product [Parnassius apollo]|uniref:(apollo) hypothetical protein n=1 Tax=Parnassius apollo TaxID=110799 RepID=A0A8S3Y2C7_PARAO|nr:unnamed protein product [Parnassius apollo]